MADYLATNTPRIRLLQTGPRGTHHMTFRYAPGATQAAALAAVTPIAELMLPFMLAGSSWESAEAAAEGSDVFLPIEWSPLVAGDTGGIASNADPYGHYVNFVGRSLGGSRVAWYLFNTSYAFGTANNRLTSAERPILTALIAAFNANSGTIVGVDQTGFVMKSYANTGINDKVAKKSRALV